MTMKWLKIHEFQFATHKTATVSWPRKRNKVSLFSLGRGDVFVNNLSFKLPRHLMEWIIVIGTVSVVILGNSLDNVIS